MLAGHLLCCTKAGPFEWSRKEGTSSSTPSRAKARHCLARKENPLLCPRTEVGKQQPVTTQHPPSPVCAAAAAGRDAPVDLSLASGLACHSTGVSSDSSCSIATASPGVSEPCDRSLAPSDRHELRSPGLNLLCPSPPSPIAQLGWEQSPSA
ncbi:MAG: hypothetical protein OXC07_04160, partial [Kistimonas sp.]|nr:hypothetical protein [Kistimonas sp.]